MMMESFNQYHPKDDVARSMSVLLLFTIISLILLFRLDVLPLLTVTGNSLSQGPHTVLMAMWHIACLLLGLRA
ncbi:MAG TPA: hypothetical protein D7I16_06310, partial [Candidatus Poseidoniales archaeon]